MTGVQTCALPILENRVNTGRRADAAEIDGAGAAVNAGEAGIGMAVERDGGFAERAGKVGEAGVDADDGGSVGKKRGDFVEWAGWQRASVWNILR